jgi:hypothetical protein
MQDEEDTHDICHARITRNFTSPMTAPPLYFPVQADRARGMVPLFAMNMLVEAARWWLPVTME